MNAQLIADLTSPNAAAACALTNQILSESEQSPAWYAYFDEIAALLEHPKSLVRNRALWILAANARWDTANRFDSVLVRFLAHITDAKPITARQCIQALALVGSEKPQHIPAILAALRSADLSPYPDSMRPLLAKDIAQTVQTLCAGAHCP